MILPDELAAKSVIPAIRAIVVRRLVEEHGLTQQEAAKLLGVTQPAVSKYLHHKRGIAIDLEEVREVERAASQIVNLLLTHETRPVQVMTKLQEASDYVRRHRLMCDLHKKLEPELDVDTCHICDSS
jgi:predicted transcriptional regulator